MTERRRAKSEKSQAVCLLRLRCFSGFIQVKGNGNKQIRVGVPRSLRGVGIKAEEDKELLCLLFIHPAQRVRHIRQDDDLIAVDLHPQGTDAGERQVPHLLPGKKHFIEAVLGHIFGAEYADGPLCSSS